MPKSVVVKSRGAETCKGGHFAVYRLSKGDRMSKSDREVGIHEMLEAIGDEALACLVKNGNAQRACNHAAPLSLVPVIELNCFDVMSLVLTEIDPDDHDRAFGLLVRVVDAGFGPSINMLGEFRLSEVYAEFRRDIYEQGRGLDARPGEATLPLTTYWSRLQRNMTLDDVEPWVLEDGRVARF